MLLLLSLALACTPLEPADWFGDAAQPVPGESLQYRLEPAHQGVAPAGTTVGPDLSLTWKSAAYAIGSYSAAKGSPAIDEDSVYVGFDDGRLRCLDKDTGQLRWTYETRAVAEEERREDDDNRGIHGTPAVWEDLVFIGDYAGWLTAVDRQTGEKVWDRHLGGSIGASPVVYQDHVFMAVEYPDPDGKAFVLDAATGRTRYETDFLGNHPHSSTSIDAARGLLIVGANNGSFSAWSFVDEAPAWEISFATPDQDAQIKSTAALDQQTAWITSWDSALHAVDLDSGQERYAFSTAGKTMSSPSLYDGVVYFGSHDGRVYAIEADPDLDVADPQDRLLWSFQTHDMIISSPTVVEETGVVLIGSNDGVLRMLDRVEGTLLWSQELDGWVSSVPVATGGSLYVTDASGTVWRFD